MQYVTNGALTYGVATEIQLSSFLQNGWKLAEVEPIKPVKVDVPKQEETCVYGRTEINRMSKENLVELAKENGLSVGIEESGMSLKKRLIELLVK